MISAFLGTGSAFSFAPYSFWPAMLIALCGLVWLLDTDSDSRHAAACGWFFALGQFATGLYWISISFQFQGEMPVWLGWVAVVGLAAYLALFPAVALFVASKLWSPSPGRVLILSACWAAAEWLRGHLLTGFPWNMVAQIWTDTPVMLQSARFVGAYGVSLITGAVFAAVALLSDRTRAARAFLILATIMTVGIILDGWLRLAGTEAARGQQLKVHLVQANITQDVEADSQRQLGILALYERMTADALAQRGRGVVIWPETSVELDIEGDPATRSRLGRTIGPGGLLILGAVGQSFSDDGTWAGSRNSLLAIDSAGTVRVVYDKARLVPFGEYLPARDILSRLGLVSVAAGGGRFIAGVGPVTLAPGIPPFSPIICYEIIYPGGAVDRVARPAWLLNISNDAWFGDSWGPHQHLAQASMRAVEEGLPVVRSTPTGVSAVIDPYGRVVHRTSIGDRLVLTADVPEPLEPTVYSRMTDVPFLLLLAITALGGVLIAKRCSKTAPT